MSGMEAVAIIGAVAAVISAFEHGDAIVKKIKEKRAAKRKVLPPVVLEQSLRRGPRAVNDAYTSGVEAYGTAFRVENDRIANDAFKDIIIRLQGVLLNHLVLAQEDDSNNNFNVVLDASDVGRIDSVNVLHELYMRMRQAAPIQSSTSLDEASQSCRLEYGQSRRITQPGNERQFATTVRSNDRDPPPQKTMTEMSGSAWMTNHRPSQSTTGPTNASSEPQFMPFLSRVNSNAASQQQLVNRNITSFNQENQIEVCKGLAKSPATTKKGLRQTFISPKPFNPPLPQNGPRHPEDFSRSGSIQASPDEQSLISSNSSASIGGPSLDIAPSSPTMSPPKQTRTERIKNKIPMTESPPAENRKRLNNKTKPKSKPQPQPQYANINSDSSKAAHEPISPSSRTRKFSFPLITRTKPPKPDYNGFCKGASLMQTGNPGMKLQNQSVSMTAESNYWTCRNSMCCFEGPAVQGRNARKRITWGFDDEIREMFGVRYRWSFLAKSHTEIENSKNGFQYQCAFCSGQGRPCTKTGEKAFIEHVSTHQAQRPDRFKMFLITYIVGRGAFDEEIFDVNLPQPIECSTNEPNIVTDSTGLGIDMNDWRDTIHSLDIEIMMEAEYNNGWQNTRNTQKPRPQIDQRSVSPPNEWKSTETSPSDLHPAPLFSTNGSITHNVPNRTAPSINPRNMSPRQHVHLPRDSQRHQGEGYVEDETSTNAHTSNDMADIHPAFRTHHSTKCSSHPQVRSRSLSHDEQYHYQYQQFSQDRQQLRVSVPDPWRTSYATLNSRHDSTDTLGGLGNEIEANNNHGNH